MANIVTPSDYLPDNAGESSLDFEQKAANATARGAANYGRRANTLEPSTSDIQLHDKLAQAAREQDPLKREVLEKQAEILAAGGKLKKSTPQPIQLSDPDEIDGSKSVMATPYGQMQQK